MRQHRLGYPGKETKISQGGHRRWQLVCRLEQPVLAPLCGDVVVFEAEITFVVFRKRVPQRIFDDSPASDAGEH